MSRWGSEPSWLASSTGIRDNEESGEGHQEWVENKPRIPDIGNASKDQIQTVEWLLAEDPNAGPDPPLID